MENHRVSPHVLAWCHPDIFEYHILELLTAHKQWFSAIDTMAHKKTGFEILVLIMSKRSEIPSVVVLTIRKYYTSLHFLSMNMYITFNYTSSIHDMELLHVQSGHSRTYSSYIYNNCVANNEGTKCVLNGTALPLDIQHRCCLDGMNALNESQIKCSRWSMVATIGPKCELSAFPHSILCGDESMVYGVYKFSLPPFPSSSKGLALKPTTVSFAESDRVLYAMNAFCDTLFFQAHSHYIYSFDFKVFCIFLIFLIFSISIKSDCSCF